MQVCRLTPNRPDQRTIAMIDSSVRVSCVKISSLMPADLGPTLLSLAMTLCGKTNATCQQNRNHQSRAIDDAHHGS